MTRVITIRVEVPDGIDVHLAPLDDFEPDPPPQEWPDPEESLPVVRAVAPGRNGGGNGLCSVHRVPWRTVPAGVSKRTGRPYASFIACPEPGCDQRPR